MSMVECDTPIVYEYIQEYLKDKKCVHEIDILNIDMSSLMYTLPSFNIIHDMVENRDILDQCIYEFLLNKIIDIDLSNTSIKSIYDVVIDKLMWYSEIDSVNINYNEFVNYYVNLYNLITSIVDGYTKGYLKITQARVFDNISYLDQFYVISDVSVNTEYDYFMLRINIALFRRNKDGTNKRNRSFSTKI